MDIEEETGITRQADGGMHCPGETCFLVHKRHGWHHLSRDRPSSSGSFWFVHGRSYVLSLSDLGRALALLLHLHFISFR
jgi:hypothetical protein